MTLFGLLDEFYRLKPRQVFGQFLNLGLVVTLALMLWKTFVIVSACESPVVVVLSGSMEPAFHRGDLLFLNYNRSQPVKAGHISVFRISKREIPIVHRTVIRHEENNETWKILTKGDNNRVNDRGLYAEGQSWVYPTHVFGQIRATAPYVGMATILMNDYPVFKYIVVGLLGLFVILFRE